MNRLPVMSRADLRGLCIRSAALAVIVSLMGVPLALGQETFSPGADGQMAARNAQQTQADMLQARHEMLQQKVHVAQAKLKEAQAELTNAADEQAKQKAKFRCQVLEAELRQILAETNLATAQAAATRAQQQVASKFQAFRLRHARAVEIADLLHQIYGEGLRVAVDERLNTLVVMSDPQTWAPVQEFVNTLDAPPEGPPEGEQAERTLQLRILWLMDGLPDDVGKEPDERFVSPMVVDVLHGLGLEHPKIICQHATTLSTRAEGRSKFTFADPVRVDDAWATFAGRGELSTVEGDRYRVELQIHVESDGGDAGEIAGSLVVPLEHYVVLGTTNYVAPEGRSLPTAFVVFLQEAPIAPR